MDCVSAKISRTIIDDGLQSNTSDTDGHKIPFHWLAPTAADRWLASKICLVLGLTTNNRYFGGMDIENIDENGSFWYNKRYLKEKTFMRRPFPKIEFPILPEEQAGIKNNKVGRLALLPYREVMDYLRANYDIPLHNSGRISAIELMGHKVAITGLKLRTFAHFDEINQPCCANPDCGLQPAYFALEIPQANKRPHYSVAYLSLYGLDKDGNEIEFTHDHTLARCFGGANTLANTTMMCFPCNNLKSRIESRLHHRTLRILKEFLEDTTGETANPQFLLERVRNSDFNFTQPQRNFEREGVVPLNEALNAIRNSKQQAHTWFGRKVKTAGVRLDAFATEGGTCCQNSECGLEATHFAVERVGDKTFYENHGYHLNMYGFAEDQREVQFMHHHMLQPGHDGVPESFSIITLCGDCKDHTLSQDHGNWETMVKNFGGVSPEDMKDEMTKVKTAVGITRAQLEKIEQNKKTLKILETAQNLAVRNNMSFEDYVAFCNHKALAANVSNVMSAKHNGIRRVVNTLTGITPAGARWFRNDQREVYGPENKTSEYPELTPTDILNTPINVSKVRKINHYAEALAEYYQLSVGEYLHQCQKKALAENVDHSLTVRMNSLRQMVAVLGISPEAARVFTRECGEILHLGPERPKDAPSINASDAMHRVRLLRIAANDPDGAQIAPIRNITSL